MSEQALREIFQRARRDEPFRRLMWAAPRQAVRGYDLTEEEILRVVLINFGWLIEGRLAGMARPGSDEAFAELARLGIRALLTLTEDPLPAAALARHDLRTEHLPVRDFGSPAMEQIERAMSLIDGYIAQGMPVVVHCMAGQGRTGTILACYLVHQGSSAADAIAAIRARRPGSIETIQQQAVIEAYAQAVASGRTWSPMMPEQEAAVGRFEHRRQASDATESDGPAGQTSEREG